MTVNLRRSLAVFAIGFAVEGFGGLAALLLGGSTLIERRDLLLLTPIFSLVGLTFLWMGRHEWSELHRRRVGHAHGAFIGSVVAIALAAAPVIYLSAIGGPPPPAWASAEFAVAIAIVFALTFVTYALVAAHLVGPVGRIAMALGLLWAFILSALIGLALSAQLSPLVRQIVDRSPAVAPIVNAIGFLDSLLAFSYIALFVAFLDAHARVRAGGGAEASLATPNA